MVWGEKYRSTEEFETPAGKREGALLAKETWFGSTFAGVIYAMLLCVCVC